MDNAEAEVPKEQVPFYEAFEMLVANISELIPQSSDPLFVETYVNCEAWLSENQDIKSRLAKFMQ